MFDDDPTDEEIHAEEAHEAWKMDAVQCACGAVLDSDHAWDIHLAVHRSTGDGSDGHYQL
jgi:hypothetical protein